MAKASKSAILIPMASNVVAIVECRGPIMASTLIRLNALTAAMCMEQMGRICMRESALRVKKEHLELGFGVLSRNEFILSERASMKPRPLFKMGVHENERVPSVYHSNLHVMHHQIRGAFSP